MIRRGAVSYVIFIVVVALHSVADAANKTWTAAVSGDFSDATRWTGGVPGSGDTATFNAAGTYTVTFDNSPNPLANPVLNQDLFFQAGNVTFTSGTGGPYTYQLTGTGGDDANITGGTLTLGTSGNPLHVSADGDVVVRGGATLNIRFGSNLSADRLLLADLLSSNGTILVDGAGSTFDITDAISVNNLGFESTGTLTYQNGGNGTFAGTLNMAVSVSNNADANLTVGTGSTLTLTNLRMMTSTAPGTGQNALLDVRGTLTLSGTLTMGHANADASSDALINITTTGVLNTGSGNININKEALITNAGLFNVNGNITLTGGGFSGAAGGINLAVGRALTVQNGGSFIAEDVTFNGNTVIVDGTGTSLDLQGHNTFADATGTTSLTIRNNASASLGSIVLGLSQASAVGNLNVESGATVTTSSITMGTTNVSGAAGNITVSGGSLTQSGTSTLRIGAVDTAATSTLSITGGEFTSGTGNVTINATGRIDIDGGTLELRGNTTIDGGVLQQDAGSFNFSSGRTMTIQNGGRATFSVPFGTPSGTVYNVSGADSTLEAVAAGSLTIANGAQANINSGGLLSSASTLTVAAATLIVDGADSTAASTGTGTNNWGAVGGSTVVFRNGATGDFNGQVALAFGIAAGPTADVTVESSADLTARGLTVATRGGTAASATLTVDGDDSTVGLLSSSDLTIGHASSGTAIINVQNRGRLTVGTGGATNLNATGRINIDGGTVDLKTLNQNGGSINFIAGSLSYIGNLTIEDNGLLEGGDLTLTHRYELTLTGTTTIDFANTLVLDGGTLTTGALVVNGNLIFNSGTLAINQDSALNFAFITNSPNATIFLNAANVSLGDATRFFGFHHLGFLSAGNGTYTLNSAGYARLGVNTSLGGGTINAPNGIYLPGGGTFAGSGTVNGRITGDAGALIIALGALNMGDAASPAGFNFDGELRSQQFAVTLRSSAQAALGNLTTLGSGANPGTLNATNGFVADFGEAVTGFGTINSSNTLAKRSIINGTMQGNSAAQPITLTGYIKGVGTFDNVMFTGTFDPGLSPTLSTVGSISFSPTNTLLMELGGTARGSQYDAILASGTLGLDGALQVALINGFAPSAGNSFDILDWGTLNGTFDTLQLPALTGGLTWNTSQLYTSGVLSIAAAGLAGDYNNNGRVDAADYVVWRENDGSQQGYNIWRTNFGRAVDAASGAASGPPRLGGPTFAVPEPASYILALTGMLTVRHRRSRRRPLQFSGLLAAKY